MRNIRLSEFLTPFASGFTTRVNQTTTWVRSKPAWYIRVLAIVAIVTGVALFFLVLLPLLLVAIVVFVVIDAINRVRSGVMRMVSKGRGEVVPPDDQGRKNVRVRDGRARQQ